MEVHTWNPRTQEVEARGPGFKTILSYTASSRPVVRRSQKDKDINKIKQKTQGFHRGVQRETR